MELTMKRKAMTLRTIDLGYEQLFLVEGGPDTRVRVLYGGTWLTEEGVTGDSVIGAGEEVSLQARGIALLEGLSESRLQIVEPPRGGISQQAGLWQRRALQWFRNAIDRLHLGARPAAQANG